jgi:hypothetical protein
MECFYLGLFDGLFRDLESSGEEVSGRSGGADVGGEYCLARRDMDHVGEG